eukprot:COSAG01_NODE_45408_length_409_cov_3.496774_1_plen_80_part_10
MPSVMPPRVTIMPNYAELCYYADYAAPMQLCRFIMLASRGMPNCLPAASSQPGCRQPASQRRRAQPAATASLRMPPHGGS